MFHDQAGKITAKADISRTLEEAERVVEHVRRTANIPLTLAGRFGKGEIGAFRVVTDGGEALVLKFAIGAQTVREKLAFVQDVLKILLKRGYPAPKYVHVGSFGDTSYWLQKEIAGEPLDHLTPVLAAEIIQINELQAESSLSLPTAWPDFMTDILNNGANGYCEHGSLRRYSERTRRILERISTIASDCGGALPQAHDIVHYDFGNILVSDGKVKGVIDWDGVAIGDRLFDLCCLMVHCSRDEGSSVLLNYLENRTSEAAIKFYVAHMVLRQLDWNIRYYGPEEVDRCLNNPNKYWKEIVE